MMMHSTSNLCAWAAAQVGFLVVMGASMLAGFRWTITQVLLQGDNKHGSAGGPVQVLFHLTPGAPPPPPPPATIQSPLALISGMILETSHRVRLIPLPPLSIMYMHAGTHA